MQRGEILERERRSQARLSEIIAVDRRGHARAGARRTRAALERGRRAAVRRRAPTCSVKSSPRRGRSSRAPRWAPRSPARWPIAAVGATRLSVHLADVEWRARARRPDLPVRGRRDGVLHGPDEPHAAHRGSLAHRVAPRARRSSPPPTGSSSSTDGPHHAVQPPFVELWRIPPDVARVGRRRACARAHARRQLRDPDAFLAQGAASSTRSRRRRASTCWSSRTAACFERYSVPQRMDGESRRPRVELPRRHRAQAAEQQLVHHAYHDALTVPAQPVAASRTAGRSISRDAARRRRHRSRCSSSTSTTSSSSTTALGHAVGDELLWRWRERLARLRAPGRHRRAARRRRVHRAARRHIEHASDADARGRAHPAGARSGRSCSTGRSCSSAPASASRCPARRLRRPTTLLRDADIAMYRAKAQRQGRATSVFDRAMHARAVARLQLETRPAAARSSASEFAHPLPAGRLAAHGARSPAWRRSCAGSIPSAASCRPTSSSPWPRRPDSSCRWASWVLREACRAARRLAARAPGAADMRDRREPVARASSRSRTSLATWSRRCRASGLPPRLPRARDHRERADAERESRRSSTLARAARHSACGSRSTTSAPATRRSATCTASRSTCSRSTARSSSDIGRGRRATRRSCAPIVALAHNLGTGGGRRGSGDAEQLASCSGVGCDLVQGYLFGGALSARRWRSAFRRTCWCRLVARGEHHAVGAPRHDAQPRQPSPSSPGHVLDARAS